MTRAECNNQTVGARLHKQSTYPVWCLGKHEEDKEMSSFSSSASDIVTNATATDTAPSEYMEASAKGGYEEEEVEGTAGADGPFDARQTERWIRQISFSSSALLNKLMSQSQTNKNKPY